MNNILYINTSDCVGGAAKVAWNLGHNLGRKYTSKYITYQKASSDKNVYKIPEDFFINSISKILGKKSSNLLRYYKGFFLSNDISYGYGWENLKDNRFYKDSDIVHLNNLHGNYFKLETLSKIDKPMVWTLHDEWAIMPHGAWSDHFDKADGFYKRKNLLSYPPMMFNNEKYLMAKKRKVYKNINPIIVVPSKWLMDKVKKSVLGDKEIVLIPNGVDIKTYKRGNKEFLREKLKLPKDKKIILFLASGGRNNPQKGWEHANKIITDLKSEYYIFLCIGGNDRKRTQENNVIYIPYITNEKILSEYYSAADIYLFTSNHENFPLTVLEAMASGLPVAAFDVGGVAEEIVDGETGVLAKMANYSNLENKLVKLLNNKQEVINNISLNASSRVIDNFSLQKMVNEYEKIYSRLLVHNRV
jgi:glycosyltransferase involved in cell wall biosynthesis